MCHLRVKNSLNSESAGFEERKKTEKNELKTTNGFVLGRECTLESFLFEQPGKKQRVRVEEQEGEKETKSGTIP